MAKQLKPEKKIPKYLKINVEKPFPKISVHALKPGDIGVVYHGNKLTEAHGQWLRRRKYGHIKPCPFHTFIVYDDTLKRRRALILDTEIRTTLSFIEFEYLVKKSIRIDIIRYPLNTAQRIMIMNRIEIIGGKEPYYGVRRFAGFVKQIWGLGWLGKILEPKGDKELVCSNRVADIHKYAGNRISYLSWKDSIPGDFMIYAVHSKIPKIYTLKYRGQ